MASSACDPNSQHQTWARWLFHVYAPIPPWLAPDFEKLRQELASWFGKLTRGGSALLNVEQLATDPLQYVITLRWDRRDVLDPSFQQYVLGRVTRLFRVGLGADTTVTLRPVVIEAGDAEDGLPPAQLLIVPTHHEPTRLMGDVR